MENVQKYLKTFYKREHPNTNKHKRRYSSTFVFNDMQYANELLYIFIPTGMAKIKKKLFLQINWWLECKFIKKKL